MRRFKKQKIALNILTFVIVIFLIFSLVDMLIENHMIHKENPNAVFVKPLPRSITETAIINNNETLIIQFNPLSEQKARAKISWGDQKNMYLNIFKNGNHLDSIKQSKYCIIAIGEYTIEVIERDSGKIVSTVNIHSKYQKPDPSFFDKPVLMEIF